MCLRNILSSVLVIFFTTQLEVNANCLIVLEDNKVIFKEGNCSKRYAPCSTFKFPLALMGFNENILKDEHSPKIQFRKGFEDWRPEWKKTHDPSLWIKNSCLWYSQQITKQLGIKNIQKYLKIFDYGNKDFSGDEPLMKAWLSSSLQISPKEQMKFLQSYLAHEFDLSQKSYDFTKKILYKETLSSRWKLYGKTGTGHAQNFDKSKNPKKQIGWFVGWIEKDKRKILLVNLIEKDFNGTYDAGPESLAELKKFMLSPKHHLEPNQ